MIILIGKYQAEISASLYDKLQRQGHVLNVLVSGKKLTTVQRECAEFNGERIAIKALRQGW